MERPAYFILCYISIVFKVVLVDTLALQFRYFRVLYNGKI